jgi:hypothetical protein
MVFINPNPIIVYYYYLTCTYIRIWLFVSSQNNVGISTEELPIVLFGPMSHLDKTTYFNC